jgi:hypothetical protein
VSVRVEVGGPAAPYALLVHEDLTAHHPVGGAKYLERAAHARERGMGARIAKRVRAMIERKAAS